MSPQDLTVAMACDRAYLYPFAVALTSYVRQASQPFALWFGLAEDWEARLSPEALEQVLTLADFLGVAAEAVQVPLSVSDLPPTLHISPTAFVKPALFDLCAPGQTLVWLDADMIAVRDWTEALDLATGTAVSAVHEAQPSFELAWPAPKADWYVNTGLVVVDGTEWQRLFAGRWLPYLSGYSANGFRYLDQDVLNATVRDQWNLLPQSYNYRLGYSGTCDDPVIRHYAGWWKPWLSTRWQMHRMSSDWKEAFVAYARAEDDFANTMRDAPPSQRRFWLGQKRAQRGAVGWRAWRHYATGVLRER